MKRRLAALSLLALIVIAGYGIWLTATPHPAAQPDPFEPITIRKMPIAAHALLYIADDRGFFAENGRSVAVRDYETGPAAMGALLNGDVEVGVSGEYVVVENAIGQEAVGIIASIDRYHFFSLAARRDRGIGNVSDLAGKTIGVGRHSNADFFLGRFLDLNGIELQDVGLVDVPPSQWVEAVTNGSVDAVVFNRQHHDEITARLGENGVVWPVQSDQSLYSVLVAGDECAAGHPETIRRRRLLRSLARAEDYAAHHPAEAKAIVQDRPDCTDEYIAGIWNDHRFSLSLDQSLVAVMEDQARWMIANNLTNATAIPDFGEYVDTTALGQVRPDAVNIL